MLSLYNINTKKIIKTITKNNVWQDYTYATLFFLVCSFFLFFVIKPTVTTIFSLLEKRDELENIDKFYDGDINRIIQLQTQLLTVREDIYLLDEALPKKIQVGSFINIFKKIASDEGIILTEFNLPSLDFKKENVNNINNINAVEANIKVTEDYEKVKKLLQIIDQSRRLIKLKEIKISKDKDNYSSESSKLKVELKLEFFYL